MLGTASVPEFRRTAALVAEISEAGQKGQKLQFDWPVVPTLWLF